MPQRPRWLGLLLAAAAALGVLAWMALSRPQPPVAKETAGVMRIQIDPEKPQPVPAPGTPLEVLPSDMAAAAPRPLEVPLPVQVEPAPDPNAPHAPDPDQITRDLGDLLDPPPPEGR